MKSFTFLIIVSGMAIAAAAVLAETLTVPENRAGDGSSYPASSQLGAGPNIPDPVHGTPGESYREPDANMPSLNHVTVYDPTLPSKPGSSSPTVPGNSDVTDSPYSGNMGVVVPEGSAGGGAKR